MSTHNFPLETAGRVPLLGYAVAVLSVAAALICTLQMEAHWQTSAPVAMLLMAVIITTRVGGPNPALLAMLLSLLGFVYFVLPPGGALAAEAIQAVRLLSLALVAGYVVWVTATERAAVLSLRRAHAELRRDKEPLLGLACTPFEFAGKPAAGALHASQQLLEQVLATLPVGVVVMNQQGDIVLSNAASKEIWGEYQVVSGSKRWAGTRGYWHATGERIVPSEWASVRALLAGHTTLNELIDIDTYDGRRKTIQNSAAPIRDAEGRTVGCVVVNEDVTERVRAQSALEESATRLQHLSRRLIALQEEERRHLSRELHDEFGQLLAAVTLHLSRVGSTLQGHARADLEESIALLRRAGEELRSLVLELRPTMLESAGLFATLRWLADNHQQRTGIATEVIGEVDEVPAEVAIACFRVVQEALTNVVRHARATHVRIELRQHDGSLELMVRDDGAGFDVRGALGRAAGRGSVGLIGMRERVQILGGRLEIDSRAGHGTRIHVALPLVEPPTARRAAG